MLKTHPFINHHVQFPNQMLSRKQKGKDWQKATLDSLESWGVQQIYRNYRFLDNYKLLDGQLINSHYLEQNEDLFDPIRSLTQKLQLPDYIRHYDRTSQPINAMIGEFIALPEVAYVKAYGDDILNARERAKKDLITKLVTDVLEREIFTELIQSGAMDQDFSSEEEKQQYLTQLLEEKRNLIPKELKNFDGTWSHISEKWGNIMLKNNRVRYNQNALKRTELRDAFATNRCFRHFKLKYGSSTGRTEESWNPINTVYEKGYNVKNPEDGIRIGKIEPMNVEDIIAEDGSLLSEKQLKSLQEFSATLSPQYKDAFGNKIDYTDFDGTPFGVDLPYLGRDLDAYPKVRNTTAGRSGLLMRLEELENEYPYLEGKHYIRSTFYWFAQKRIGRICYIDPETDNVVVEIVDEDFIVPPHFKVINTHFQDEEYKNVPNTIIWTWDNELWQGKKLTGNLGQGSIYYDCKPCAFQCKGDGDLWEKKLPVVGMIYNNRNVEGQSFIDLLKPGIILYNTLMNYAFGMIERQLLPFIVMDPNLIPDNKDWANRSVEKWLEVGQAIGVTIADTNYATAAQAQIQGGQFPRVIDADTTPRIAKMLELAEAVNMMNLQTIGFSPQRLGNVKASETATGIQQAKNAGYTQTAAFFAEFQDYNKRCLQMGLNFDQFVQSQSDDVQVLSLHSDPTLQFLKLVGTESLMGHLMVDVDDNLAEFEKLQMMKEFALGNNTIMSSVVARLDIIGAETTNQVRYAAKIAEEEMLAQQAQMREMEQQQMENLQQAEAEQLAWEKEKFYIEEENKYRALILATFGKTNGAITPIDELNASIKLEQIQAGREANQSNNNLKRDQLKTTNQSTSPTRDYITQQQIELEKLRVKRDEQVQKNFREKQRTERANKTQNSKSKVKK